MTLDINTKSKEYDNILSHSVLHNAYYDPYQREKNKKGKTKEN